MALEVGRARREGKVIRSSTNTTADAVRHNQVKPRSRAGMLNMCIDTHGNQPDSPGSARRHADLLNKCEGHANTPNMCRNAHGNVDGSNTPENDCERFENTCTHVRISRNVSKIPNSPSRSAETHTEEPEKLGNPSCASGMRTHKHSD